MQGTLSALARQCSSVPLRRADPLIELAIVGFESRELLKGWALLYANIRAVLV